MFLNTINTDGGVSGYEFPTTDNGAEYSTLVNVGTIGDQLSMATKMTIIGTAEETSKGLRRVLIKVEIPYASVQTAQCCGSDVSTHTVDQAKSGAVMSLHMVLTLPAQAVKDLGVTGATSEAVTSRIGLLQSFMTLLTLPGVRVNGTDDYFTSGLQSVGILSNHLGATARGYGLAFDELTNTWYYALDPAGTATPGYGFNNPFVRGASLLKPFKTLGTYGLNSAGSGPAITQ